MSTQRNSVSDPAQDKLSETEFWDRVARQRVYAAFDEEEYSDVFNRVMPDVQGKTVIDIGSASGISCALLAQRGATVIGMDISPELIQQARRLWADLGERIRFMVGDAENLELESGTMDYCFFGGVLHHFPERRRVLSECSRVLKKSGHFVAIEPNRRDFLERIEWKVAEWRGKLSPNEYPIDPYLMKSELEQSGFCEVGFYNIRHDIPFLAQFPVMRRFFSRQKGHGIKRPLLRVLNRLRPSDCCGTFFVIHGKR